MDHIVVRALSKQFAGPARSIEALRDVDLTVGRGRFVSVIGRSGCGKSTLLRIVGGLVEPSAGTVVIGGLPPQEAQRRKSIGFVFQDPGLLPWRTVTANVELSLEVNRSANRRRPRGTADLLDLVGLSSFHDAYPHQLSGGMQQRVAIARALVHYPSILLMDEPFGALDEITRAHMRYELLHIWGRTGKTVLFVTHSIAEAIVLSDAVVVLAGQPGRLREVVPIELPRPRDESIERSPAFLEYAARLRAALLER
ncbi:MAG: ABC transporter ATP-binding protein [Chloroflexi bacterium]|nr:ABC transporter ATP-binding protein [Chloroflexota bacterium]